MGMFGLILVSVPAQFSWSVPESGTLADRGQSRPLYLLLQLLATNAAVQEVFYCILFFGGFNRFFFSPVSPAA